MVQIYREREDFMGINYRNIDPYYCMYGIVGGARFSKDGSSRSDVLRNPDFIVGRVGESKEYFRIFSRK